MWGGNPGPRLGLYDTTPAGVLTCWLLLVAIPGATMATMPGKASTTRGSDQGMPSGDSSVLTKPFLWHVFVVLVNIASELHSPTSLVILWVAFHSLFLLKLAKSSFHWMQISILTDCTFHWLSAANPSGKQKPQPLPQTSLFLLRKNNLESNL